MVNSSGIPEKLAEMYAIPCLCWPRVDYDALQPGVQSTARDSLLASARGQSPPKTERNWAQKAVSGSEWKPARGKPSTDIRVARRAQGPQGRHCGGGEDDRKQQETVPDGTMVEESFLGTKLSPAVDGFPVSMTGTFWVRQ